jgi:tRNA(fMet)-specific endonuclease VapC
MLGCSLILDTDIIVALLKGKKEANEAMQALQEKGDEVATTVISAYELLKGAYLSYRQKDNLAEVQELLSNIHVLDLTLKDCEEASVIYQDVRRTGCSTGEFDVLIAAIARTYNETIMTRDQHFKSFKGIKTVDW